MSTASLDPFDKMLQRSIQELRDLQPTLLDAATYAEEAYLVTDQKDIELNNVRDYAVSMLVSVVDRIGSAADRFTDAVSQQAKELAAADVRVASAAERVRACWEYSGRNALNRQQQPKASSRMPKSYTLPGEATAAATPALAAARAPSVAPPAAAASMERECFQYGSGYSTSPTRGARGSSYTACSSSSLLSSMPLAPPSESLDSLASSSTIPHLATAGVPSVRASLDCLAGLPSSSSSPSSFPSSFPSSTAPLSSSSTLSFNPSATTPHSADKLLSRKHSVSPNLSHSHNLSHSPNLSHSHNLAHSHTLSHSSNLSRSHNLSQPHSSHSGLMHSLSHSLSQHMGGHRGSHSRNTVKDPTTPKAQFPLTSALQSGGGAAGADGVESSDRRSTTPHRRSRQILKNMFSRGAGGGAAGGGGGGESGTGGHANTERG
ncbi:hypothetical protein CLOM_g7660 [Closterium sp. NIES-68]|nr:hypothetical protein CLOM_g7660 [Closterium sp. NIES-68]GJP65875.1 hypothetical protein CLOP_g22779 [Closterium sp. NIES-67]